MNIFGGFFLSLFIHSGADLPAPGFADPEPDRYGGRCVTPEPEGFSGEDQG